MAASLGVRSAWPTRPVTQRLMRRSVRRRRSSSSGGCLAGQGTLGIVRVWGYSLDPENPNLKLY